MKNRLLKPTAFIIGVIMIGLLSVSYASAQTEGNYVPIVQKLAQRFNLNEKDVQAVFDEEREERFADMQAEWSEKLDDLVNSGKITKEQKEAIIDKHEDIHNKMLDLKDLTPEERRQEMKKIHEEFKTWAEEQGIDLPLLGPMKFMHKKGMGHGLGEFSENFKIKLEN